MASAFGMALPVTTHSAAYTVASGAVDTSQKSVGGVDIVTVQSGATLSVDDTAIKWNDASTGLVINNAGVIESTQAGGRAINAGGTSTVRTVTLNNAAGAVIQSQDDAFRINTDITSGAVVVNNAGRIESTAGGQAIDFDAVSSTQPGQIQINNAATGVIIADDADAIRPGQGAVVTNAGLIYASGGVDDSHDGVDFQAHTGTVVNLAGGVISGERHGVVSDTGVSVYNGAAGTIIGRNGSGVNSDGYGYVVNYGTITGASDGSATGDGDGVDIDGYGLVINHGLIQGVGAAGYGSDGRLNTSEGVSESYGAIINLAGGTIYSVDNGVVFNGSTGSFLYNAGTIIGYDAVQFSGQVTNDVLVNAGVITGVGYAIYMGPGDDTLVIKAGSVITGLVDGWTGYDTIRLETGAVFDSAVNFEHLQVDGSAIITGDSSIATTSIASGATLQLGMGGTSGSVGGAIDDEGVLALDRSDAVTFDGLISGGGGLEQIGTGTTILAGLNTYTGGSMVEAGILEVDGLLPYSTVQVAGGVLQGTGMIGGLSTTGGTVAPGGLGTLGVLSVAGNATLTSGVLAIDVAGDGVSDKLAIAASTPTAGGHITLGGDLVVTAQSGYAPRFGDAYQVVTATGGVSGAFASVSGSGFSGVLYPEVSYLADAVDVTIGAHSYSTVINTGSPVQRAYAQLLDQSRGSYAQMSTLYGQLDVMDAAPLQATLEAMAPSAETTASTVARMEQDTLAHLYRERIDASRGGAAAASGLAVIGQPFQLAEAGQDHGLIANQNASDASTAVTTVPNVQLPQGVSAFFAGGYLDGSGRPLPSAVSAGHQDRLDGWYVAVGGELAVTRRLTLGGALAYAQGEGSLLGASTATDNMTQFALYGSYLLPLGMFVDGQVAGGPARTRTTRSFEAGDAAYDLASHDSPSAEQAEFDLSRPFALPYTVVLTPSAGVRYAHLGFGASTETGGDAALTYASHDIDSLQTRFGLSAAASVHLGGWSIAPKLDATYVHDFDADREDFGAVFAEGGSSTYATFFGPERARDWAEVGAGITVSAGAAALRIDAQSNVGRDDLSFQTYSASATVRF